MDIKAKISDFTDLIAWQEGHKLVLAIYDITKKFPTDERFGLINQLRKAAVSVTSNIAEGFRRNSYKEKTQFYSMSFGSIAEIQNQLLIAKDLEYITQQEFDTINSILSLTSKLTRGLIKSSKLF